MRPLYAGSNNASLAAGNAGLWYDKYCDRWGVSAGSQVGALPVWSLRASGNANPKLDWIAKVTKDKVGEQRLLEEAADRLARLLAAHGQTALFFKTDGPFVTGLGREHPVENGFAWHHISGAPYLPGSSVKGMVRAWAESWIHPEPDVDLRRQIFGPRGAAARESSAVGSVIFLDALPTKPVQLQADVMTPHYAPYYQDATGETPPADWHSPTPIPFLVVSRDTTFQFGMLPRRPDASADVDTVRGWLTDALDAIGAGAKTAVGYGRFEPVEQESAASQWLKDKIVRFCQQHNAREQDVLRGRLLAEEWQQIGDATLRSQVRDHIRKRWQERGWWDSPPGRRAQQAKAIYER